MPGGTATVHSGAAQPVPAVAFHFAGFPCQDVSVLNPHARSSRDTIAESPKRTGKVFGAVAGYAAAHGQALQAGFLEN
eukprot:13294732-Alexandrium_andersonii.AAC.1